MIVETLRANDCRGDKETVHEQGFIIVFGRFLPHLEAKDRPRRRSSRASWLFVGSRRPSSRRESWSASVPLAEQRGVPPNRGVGVGVENSWRVGVNITWALRHYCLVSRYLVELPCTTPYQRD